MTTEQMLRVAESVKGRVHLPTFAKSIIPELRRNGREHCGPCPLPGCGGTDRFVVHADERGWLCRKCSPQGGDVITLAQKLWNCSWIEAAKQLGEDLPEARPIAAPPPEPPPWADLSWQEQTAELVRRFERALPGSPAHRYLESRAIPIEHATRYRLGYQKTSNAVVIPWISASGEVTALKSRYIEPVDPKRRFIQRRGSQQLVYGAHLYRGRPTVLVEGEFNAISLALALPEYDVLSPGGQSNNKSWSALGELAIPVLAWVDEPERAHQLIGELPRQTRILCSPEELGERLDANDILTRYGAESLRELVLARIGGENRRKIA